MAVGDAADVHAAHDAECFAEVFGGSFDVDFFGVVWHEDFGFLDNDEDGVFFGVASRFDLVEEPVHYEVSYSFVGWWDECGAEDVVVFVVAQDVFPVEFVLVLFFAHEHIVSEEWAECADDVTDVLAGPAFWCWDSEFFVEFGDGGAVGEFLCF